MAPHTGRTEALLIKLHNIGKTYTPKISLNASERESEHMCVEERERENIHKHSQNFAVSPSFNLITLPRHLKRNATESKSPLQIHTQTREREAKGRERQREERDKEGEREGAQSMQTRR